MSSKGTTLEDDTGVEDTKVIDEDTLVNAAKELHDAALKKAKKERLRQIAQSTRVGPHGEPMGNTSDKKGIRSESEIEDDLEPVVDWFKEYLKPDPNKFEPVIEKINKVETAFGNDDKGYANADLEALDTAKNEMQSWSGDLSDKFTRSYLEPAPIVAKNQGAIATNLRFNLAATKAIYMAGRQDALEIAKKGKEAIDAISDCDGAALKIALAIALGLLGPAGVLLSGASTAVKLVHATIQSAGGSGSGFVKEGKEVELGGDDVKEVIANVKDALKKIDERIQKEEDHVTEQLTKVNDTLGDLYSDHSTQSPIVSAAPPMKGLDGKEITAEFYKPAIGANN